MGALVFVIVPGIGLLYGGMARRKSALAMVFQAWTVMAVCSFQWAFWGFSLAFSRDGGPFIGTLTNFGMIDVRLLQSCSEIGANIDTLPRFWLHHHGALPSFLISSLLSTS